jgi:acetylornithine deacetylase/succinyl-diaminopimelate desuccinylase-like protein
MSISAPARRSHANLLAPFLLALATASALAGASSQSPPPASPETLLAEPAIRAALDVVKREEPRVIDDQIRLCEIPSPPFGEARRAEAYRSAFEQLGLKNVRIDREGNVLGERPGRAARPHLVMSAHLDTVFPENTKVAVTRSGAVLKGPGISDDCRGLAVLLGIIRGLNGARVETEGPVTFVGTVGEEGLGDLRGVKQLFSGELKGTIDRFVSIDGAGAGITHTAVGSRRYRVTFRGPGGHSFGDFGIANPVHALGRAIADIATIEVPASPKTTFNVGRIGGGTSVNSIAAEAWMEVDMRSSDQASLAEVDARIGRAIDRALEQENARWRDRGRLSVEKKLVGDRPPGAILASAPIVATAVAISRGLGITPSLDEGSTDANLPLSLGIPAITIDGGGSGEGSHSLDERFDATDSWLGTARALALTVALSRAGPISGAKPPR